jgi:hypothetical protein
MLAVGMGESLFELEFESLIDIANQRLPTQSRLAEVMPKSKSNAQERNHQQQRPQAEAS